jgi:ATP-dependent DNA helicase RecG
VIDALPEDLRRAHNLVDMHTAISEIHFPTSMEKAHTARRRLAFEELFMLILHGAEQKRVWQSLYHAHTLPLDEKATKTFLTSLPFELTPDQLRSVKEILTDIAGTIPMNRLLEGDVGAGKTVVAAAAIFAAFRNKRSSIFMAPTQILAQQHFETLQKLLSIFNIPVSLIVGGSKNVTTDHVGVYVGTHALLSEKIAIPDVSLIVIDEQQRFGVNQRAALQQAHTPDDMPHVLTMTATPIPRTIAQVIFGNLDLSALASMPHGRQPVKTWVVAPEKRQGAYTWIASELTQHKTQAFVVCPLIEESETLVAVRAVNTEYEKLKKIFPKHTVGLLHGRLKPKEKTAILEQFRDKKIDILVSTPVVEVGIDIPNATIMVIEAADRFGLSQLHQLRGRVGRSNLASYCLLFTENMQEMAIKRLKAMETTHNGPQLAELDLSLRGPGELYGTAQHGVPDLKVATFTDSSLLADAQKAVGEILAQGDLSKFPLLRERLNTGKINPIQS